MIWKIKSVMVGHAVGDAYDAIPKKWRDTLLRRDYIEDLCQTACENWAN